MDELVETLDVAIESAAFQRANSYGGRANRTATARETTTLRNQIERVLQDLPPETTVAELLVALDGGYDEQSEGEAA